MSLFTYLPAELIRTILHILDPTSFYMCLQTSKLFRQHASASPKLLRDQLSRIPGQRVLPADIALVANDASGLISLFSRRAVQHLACGTEWMSDMRIWSTSADKKVDRKNSQLVLWESTSIPDKRIVLLEVVRDATVNVYVMLDGEEMLCKGNGKKKKSASRRDFVPKLMHSISPHGLSKYLPEYLPGCRAHGGQYEVVKVAQCPYPEDFGTKGIEGNLMVGVLYRRKTTTTSTTTASCKCERKMMKLLVFDLDRSFGPIVVGVFDVGERDDYNVVAMGLAYDRAAILVLRHCQLGTHKIITYWTEIDAENDSARYTTWSERSVPEDLIAQERISAISISLRTIRLFPTSFPMPYWIVPRLPNSMVEGASYEINRIDTILPDITGSFQKRSLGRAIACHHHHHHYHYHPTTLDYSGKDFLICLNTALELVISNEDCITSSRKGAFLLKALEYPNHCTDFDLHKDYALLAHMYVAQLAGLPQLDNLSTLGLIVAVSPWAHRIAIASWRTLKVWSLDPQAFLDPEYSLGGAERASDDSAFFKDCGWQYYSSEPIDRNCVMLYPVQLPNSAVIYTLEFRSEDELWGWTENGLCRWNFGPGANGKREISGLEDM